MLRRAASTLNTTDNQLLGSLPAQVHRAVAARLEQISIPVRTVIYEPGDRIEHLYLPIDAVISVVTVMRDGTQIEALTVGREGLTGAQALLDGATPSQLTWCQVGGESYRIGLTEFTELYEHFAEVRSLVARCLSAQLDVMAQSIACNRLHFVNERCARSLLMMLDRVGRDTFPLTHEVLAAMLGVRRAGVSIAAAALQSAGCISYVRGRFTVVDRAGLEGAACECYAAINEAFRRRGLAAAQTT